MTMQFNLSDAASFREYFESICRSHKQLGPEAFLYGDLEIGQSEAATWSGLKLWAWPAEGGRGSTQNDNYYLMRDGSIWVGGPCVSDLHDDQQTFYFSCESVVKDIISRILKDYQASLLSIKFGASTVKRADMEFSSTRLIGCELALAFDDPNGLEYDETKWN